MKVEYYKDIQIEIEKRFPDLIASFEDKKLVLSGFCIDGVKVEDNDGKLIIGCNKVQKLINKNVAEYIYTHLEVENVEIRYNSDANLYLYPTSVFGHSAEGYFDRRMWMLRIIDALQALLTVLNLIHKSSKHVNSSPL